MDKPLIAVIEDEEHLAQGLLFNLAAEGYRTHHESDGNSALAWLLADPQVDALITGATKLAHLDDAIASFQVALSPQERSRLESPYRPHRVLGHPG